MARSYEARGGFSELVVLCGPSGSGKSTWIEQHSGGSEVLSLDALREQIAGKRDNQSKNGQVQQAAFEKLKEALRQKRSIIWDATNLRLETRGKVISLGLNYGARTRIVAFGTPVELLRSRNRSRQYPIPSSVLEKQIAGYELPFATEAHSVAYVFGDM